MRGAKQCLIKLQAPPVNVALHLFNSIIKPILCYGCEIWGFTVKEEIERIEVQYLKYILHLPNNATWRTWAIFSPSIFERKHHQVLV